MHFTQVPIMTNAGGRIDGSGIPIYTSDAYIETSREKGGDHMNTAAQRKNYDYRSPEYIREMKNYLDDLKKADRNDPEVQKKNTEFMIHAGLAHKNGKMKKKIVSWE